MPEVTAPAAAPSGLEHYKLLVVSTAALRPETSRYLTDNAGEFDFIVANFREGHYVSCQSLCEGDAGHYPDGPAMDDLHAVRTYAVRHGFQYVMLDADAEVPQGLEDYSELW